MARTSGSGARVGGASGAYSPVASKIVGQTTPSGLTQAGRVAQLLTPLGGGAGLGAAGIMAGLDRAGVTTPGEDDTLLESGARGFGKFATDTSFPGLLTRGVGMLTGDEKTGTFAQTLSLIHI